MTTLFFLYIYLFCHILPDGVLSLEAEQKCGCEVLDILDTDFGDIMVRNPGVQVTVGQGDQEPDLR